MAKALYVPCYAGELGWEIINYAPHVNYLVSRGDYDEVHIVVRNGREALYPMGTHWYPINLSSEKSMGNTGPDPPSNNIAKKLRSSFDVDKVSKPKRGMRYIKGRKFLKYEADPETTKKWSYLPSNAVTLCVRGRKFGMHKNWEPKHWINLCEHLISKGYSPVLTGLKGKIQFGPPDGCIDIMGGTDLKDMIAIFKLSKFVVGQSTGPMHLASMCGVPHAVWGSLRIKERYLDTWNPHKTMVEYQDCANDFQCSRKEVFGIVNKLIERIK